MNISIIHNTITCNTTKVETTHMSINLWMDKNKCGITINGILFSNKKKWNNDTCYNMDEPKWKKSGTKGHILYDSIYKKCPDQMNPKNDKVD